MLEENYAKDHEREEREKRAAEEARKREEARRAAEEAKGAAPGGGKGNNDQQTRLFMSYARGKETTKASRPHLFSLKLVFMATSCQFARKVKKFLELKGFFVWMVGFVLFLSSEFRQSWLFRLG